MRVHGNQAVCGGGVRGLFPPAGRSSGSGFLERLEKASDAAASEKAADTLRLTKTDNGLPDLLRRLTPGSRDVLDRIQAGGKDVSKDEWNGLCKELESLGAISEADRQYTQAGFRFIPIGYQDENGRYVTYDTPPTLKNKLLNLYHSQGPGADRLWACLDEDGWKGDPLAYLDNWMSSLYSWRSDLARARNEDGSPKYGGFSPITSQINSCRKVMDLVRGLCQAKI